jgi:thiol-disulfide isomerase/thioredoxin
MELTKDKKIGAAVILIIITLVIAGTVYIRMTSLGGINKDTVTLFSSNGDAPTYVDIHGNQVQLDEYLGRIMVVNSFASWTPFSATDLANLNELASRYNEEDVVFIAINRKETKEQVQRYVATLPAYDRIRYVIDQEDRFYVSVGGYAMPETLIFDAEGTMVEQIRGSLTVEQVDAIIMRILNPE